VVQSSKMKPLQRGKIVESFTATRFFIRIPQEQQNTFPTTPHYPRGQNIRKCTRWGESSRIKRTLLSLKFALDRPCIRDETLRGGEILWR
jgi:hypothetical protein